MHKEAGGLVRGDGCKISFIILESRVLDCEVVSQAGLGNGIPKVDLELGRHQGIL